MQSKPLQSPQKTELVKSTQALSLTIQANDYSPSDGLEAITKLHALILCNNNNGTTKYKTVEPVNVPTPIKNNRPIQEPALIPNEEPSDIQNTPTLGLSLPSPAIIPQYDIEDTPNRCNLQ